MAFSFHSNVKLRLRASQGGFTLIELMVAMAIGMIVVLAVTGMIVVSQTHERVTTGANDMSQSGAFTATILDNSIRSAGAGFSQYWNRGVMGCKLNVKRDGAQILPRTTALPAPFAAVMGGSPGVANLRLAPLLIAQGQSAGGSDVLIAMSGLANVGDVPRAVRTYTDADSKLYLENTVSIRQGDVLVVSREGTTDCILTQVDGGTPPFSDTVGQTAVPLGGTYFNTESADGSVTLNTLALNSAGRTMLSAIGSADNLQMQAFGVGADSVLYRYDLLRSSGQDASEAMAEGVVAMRAIYGVDSNIDDPDATRSPAWQEPTGDFDLSALIAQSPPTRMRSITAVRIALLVRSNARQNQVVADASYTLLEGQPGAATVSVADADRHYAHRIVETTIPLRSMMMRLLPPEELL